MAKRLGLWGFVCVVSGMASAGPMVLWWSDPVKPNETVLIEGGGWTPDATVEAFTVPDGPAGNPAPHSLPPTSGRVALQPLLASNNSIKVVWSPALPMGLLALRVQSGGAVSAPIVLNAPTIWWRQGDWGGRSVARRMAAGVWPMSEFQRPGERGAASRRAAPPPVQARPTGALVAGGGIACRSGGGGVSDLGA